MLKDQSSHLGFCWLISRLHKLSFYLELLLTRKRMQSINGFDICVNEHACAMSHMLRSEDKLPTLIFSFCHVGSEELTSYIQA